MKIRPQKYVQYCLPTANLFEVLKMIPSEVNIDKINLRGRDYKKLETPISEKDKKRGLTNYFFQKEATLLMRLYSQTKEKICDNAKELCKEKEFPADKMTVRVLVLSKGENIVVFEETLKKLRGSAGTRTKHKMLGLVKSYGNAVKIINLLSTNKVQCTIAKEEKYVAFCERIVK